MGGVDIILHTAALKLAGCTKSPGDAVRTNIKGVRKIIIAATEMNMDRVLFTWSDKAVNPSSVMGTSNVKGERLLKAANVWKWDHKGPIFASTRFGNVFGLRGSVISIFEEQIAEGGPVTLTDRRITRFITTLKAVACLVLDSVFCAKGGEVFVTKMTVVRIEDLAHVMPGRCTATVATT